MTSDKFEPRIMGFLCNWCCYTAADSAGVARYQYPPNIRVIRVMCSGRVDPVFIFEAFSCGADGVFVGGCHLGECHYQLGNYDVMLATALTKKIMTKIGISPERLLLEWASAAEGSRYVQMITEFTNNLKSLGPLGTTDKVDMDVLKVKLSAARHSVEDMKLRTGLGNLTKGFRKEGDYSAQTIEDKIDQKIAKSIDSAIGKQETLLWIQQEGPISLDVLTKKVGQPTADVEKYVSAFSKKGLVTETNGKLSATSNE
ncbi:MAG: hydrogenase iron-sulfur subunit [Proteobacteria bacterium]|nr:hydrogenase iron-sulfur subunit [Desulfobacteraceae bacterium]MBU3980422.1 hydrogenase iron-sulfur subunit [Pseudomonadota bacterium]MBU3984098.1 hydrogenase iron-sulfur subunit [Pseudomonadota bacterium]MBU4013231.1 hydrogenase iron-sulfur subunit [Pseudomonadota bacterium]MBU4067866.1 hydrogenase iron-sulfur subunit [Pseudomonadota bacterium]